MSMVSELSVLMSQSNIMLFNVRKQTFRPENLFNPIDLPIYVTFRCIKEGRTLENSASKKAAKRPDIRSIGDIDSVIEKNLRRLVVHGPRTGVVVARPVELGEPPVNQPDLVIDRINHNVLRFDVSMYDALRMTILQSS